MQSMTEQFNNTQIDLKRRKQQILQPILTTKETLPNAKQVSSPRATSHAAISQSHG
jgi:hypothetical protein